MVEVHLRGSYLLNTLIQIESTFNILHTKFNAVFSGILQCLTVSQFTNFDNSFVIKYMLTSSISPWTSWEQIKYYSNLKFLNK